MWTQIQLRQMFDFDAKSGQLIWKYDSDKPLRWNSRCVGKAAGSNRHKYIAVGIYGVKYYAHRLIWIYLYGYDPIDIDHIDGDSLNNRPENLREATSSQNIANANFRPGRGVEAHGARYRARIMVQGNRLELGSFDSFEEANTAYQEAADKYFGEFAQHNRAA